MLDTSVLDGIGWKIHGDSLPSEAHERTGFVPRFWTVMEMLPMLFRASIYTVKQWLQNKEIFINMFSQLQHDPYTGLPIGGIGCGSIGTDFRGGFNKYSLIPGVKEQSQGNIKANQVVW
ncbi:unnamed protein product [Cylicostephanus goldi]|uniref:Glycosyl-hydrolase family 116 N-terminal domain-containing protein n=1 Tax=Cylicostephanus goldi TaxID=71465 RepID=A0A3P6RKT9_CYLGO|nr:unnamed protein product [Cylicostephanus goldi]